MRLDYKEWYLVELYNRLERILGAHRASLATNEIREHLEETTEDLVRQGHDQSLATKAAVDTLGSPQSIALSFLDQGQKQLNLLLSSALVISFLFLSVAFKAFPFVENYAGLSYLQCFLVVFAGLAITWKTKRGVSWWSIPLFLSGAILLTGIGSYLYIGSGRWENATISDTKERLAFLKENDLNNRKVEHEAYLKWVSLKDAPVGSRGPVIAYVNQYKPIAGVDGGSNLEILSKAIDKGSREIKAGEFRKQFASFLGEIQYNQRSRSQAIERLNRYLNVPVKTRFASRIGTTLSATLWFGTLLCWFTNLLAKIWRSYLIRSPRIHA
jgi:hypothetical protein